MSTLKVDAIRHTSGTSDAIDLSSNDMVTISRDNTGSAPYIALKLHNSATSAGVALDCDDGALGLEWEIQSNPSGELITYCRDTNTYGFRMDSSGNIRTPNSVAFYATNTGTGSEQGDGITTNPPVFPTAVLNRGGAYNTSNGRFTAPVSGLYTFTGNPGYKQNSLDFAVRLQKNGGDVTDVIRYIGALNSHSGMSFACTIYLAANDYVTLNMAGSGVNAYHRNNSSVPNWFAGYLVG